MPAVISGVVPTRVASGPILGAPKATISPAGRNASAVPSADQPSSCCMYSVPMNWKPT